MLNVSGPSKTSSKASNNGFTNESETSDNSRNVLAGEEANNKLWKAIKESNAHVDSISSKLYDYLFTDTKGKTNDTELQKAYLSKLGGSQSKEIDDPENIDESLSYSEFLYTLFEKVFDLEPETPDLENFYRKDSNGNKHTVETSGMDKIEKDGENLFSINYLKSIIKMNDMDVKEMKSKHQRFTKFLKKLKLPQQFYKKGSSGIVYVGGGKFTWFALLSIKNVRKIGSTLPIELFIPSKNEYEYVVCEEILPKLNAKCVLMYEFLKDDESDTGKNKKKIFSEHQFKGFTYKSLALLLSSFENILLLDADNVPYFNPDTLFVNEPYTSDHFVLWPDYWQRSTSPFFYDIADIDLQSLNPDVPKEKLENDMVLHKLKGTIPNPSTESGQLMISKKTHWDVLILSLYYNICGPKHYYHLFSQGAAGQGDKETFLAAATVLGSKFYQVTSKVSAIGYFKKDGGDYSGTAQGQKSPVQDYQLKKQLKVLQEFYKKQSKEAFDAIEDKQIAGILRKVSEGKELNEDECKVFYKYHNIEDPQVFFIHESTPKLDPVQLIHEGAFINNEVKDPKTNEYKRIRFYANYITNKGNYQFEKFQIDYIYELLCEKNLVFRFIEDQINKIYNNHQFDKESFCKKLDDQRNWLAQDNFE